MARRAITVLSMTTVNSSVSAVPTLTSLDTLTGAYIDVNNIDASKLIFVFTKTSSGANTGCKEFISIEDGDSKIAFSAYKLGDLVIEVASGAICTAPTDMLLSNLVFAGPFETARFKDSQGRIKINSSRGINIHGVGAILIK